MPKKDYYTISLEAEVTDEPLTDEQEAAALSAADYIQEAIWNRLLPNWKVRALHTAIAKIIGYEEDSSGIDGS